MKAFRLGVHSLLLLSLPAFAARPFESLAGEWRFALDPANAGVTARWFATHLEDRIALPGTTDSNQKGTLNTAREADRLTRLYPYSGAAWYQRDIDVPAGWAGQRVSLVLERTKSSRLWVDGRAFGKADSLVAPHVYELGALAPGRHEITLRIDNSEHAPIGDPHQISDHTQTNWNGIIGRIGLEARPALALGSVAVYPDRAARRVHVRAEILNAGGKPVEGTLNLFVAPAQSLRLPFSAAAETQTVEADYPLAPGAAEWDEFRPTLHRLALSLQSSAGRDSATVEFGLREFKAVGAKFQINGRTTFLRGKHDACVFPLTGHPPMDVASWMKVFSTARAYGINHYRFHTWFPPEAAFEAADRLGIYLAPELPNWQQFGEKAHDEFQRAEGERILRQFGNHPSFVMFSLGNELGGKQELMAPFISHFRSLDSRHLYSQGTNNWFPTVYSGDDYWSSFQVKGRKIRGSFATVDAPLGHVQTGPPSTLKDYSDEIAGFPVPVVSHEIGEYQVAPDFKEIEKYTGVVRARNFELFRERMERNGLLDQAPDFLRASGRLALLCYREDIEAALRTPDFAGFQLLDLQDFPGQGTALVGVLNAFMEPKPFLSVAEWRRFCAETVPLVRMEKYTWTTAETFTARAEVAHYGERSLGAAGAVWTLKDGARTLAEGRLPVQEVKQGALTRLGEIRIPLQAVRAPAHLSLELALQGTAAANRYDLWVYDERPDVRSGAVIVSRAWDDATRKALENGASVLYLPEPAALKDSIEGAFASDFWNFGMFKKFAEQRHVPVAPGTLGIWCDPAHPALAAFPTEFHSNWQWFHLLMNSRAMILDSLPGAFRPILQVIDNYERAHRLGTVFEAKVGRGRLLVCSIDLPGQQAKPEARQLLHSLLAYMQSARFAPAFEMDSAAIERVVR